MVLGAGAEPADFRLAGDAEVWTGIQEGGWKSSLLLVCSGLQS